MRPLPRRRSANRPSRGIGAGGNTLLLVAVLLAACASEPKATYRGTYQSNEIGSTKQVTTSHLGEIGIQERLGSDLEYRLSDRLLYSEQTLEQNGSDFDTRSRLHQPSLDLLLTSGAFRWQQGFEQQLSQVRSDLGGDNDLRRNDILEKVEWSPFELPRFTAWVNRRTTEDDLFVDRSDTEYVLQVDDSRGPFTTHYSFTDETLEDENVDVEDHRTEHVFRGTYEQDYIEGKLTGKLGLFLDERRNRIRSPGFGGNPLQVQALAGLSGVDTTPEVSALTSTAALIDGDLDAGTTINIGGFASGGQTDWNMGLDLPPNTTIDLAYLYTHEELDSFEVQQLSFSFWISDDGTFWTQASSSLPFTYELAFRRFRLILPQVSARFVKIVNTSSPPAAPAILVTELEVYQPLAAGSDLDRIVRRKDSIQSATGGLEWRPRDDLLLGYDVLVQSEDSEDAEVQTRDETRIDNGLTAQWTASETVALNLRLQNQRIQDPIQVDQDLYYANGLLSYDPLRTLGVFLNYTWTKRREDGATRFDTEGVQVGSTAQLLETLELELAVEQNRQRDFVADRTIDRTIFTSTLTAELTPTLDLSLAGRKELADVTGSGADQVPDPAEDRADLVLLYRPADRFTTEVRLEYRDNYVGNGVDQRYRVDWIPFQDGAIDLQFDVDHFVADTTTSASADRYLLLARWTFNPRLFLELNLARLVPENAERTDTYVVFLNFAL